MTVEMAAPRRTSHLFNLVMEVDDLTLELLAARGRSDIEVPATLGDAQMHRTNLLACMTGVDPLHDAPGAELTEEERAHNAGFEHGRARLHVAYGRALQGLLDDVNRLVLKRQFDEPAPGRPTLLSRLNFDLTTIEPRMLASDDFCIGFENGKIDEALRIEELFIKRPYDLRKQLATGDVHPDELRDVTERVIHDAFSPNPWVDRYLRDVHRDPDPPAHMLLADYDAIIDTYEDAWTQLIDGTISSSIQEAFPDGIPEPEFWGQGQATRVDAAVRELLPQRLDWDVTQLKHGL